MKQAGLVVGVGFLTALLALLGLTFFLGAAAVAASQLCVADQAGVSDPGEQGATPNAAYIWTALLANGLTDAAAAGVLGNLAAESGMDPRARQPPDPSLADGPGIGIAQWSQNARWADLVAWAHNKGADEWSLKTQVKWLLKEMHQGWGSFDFSDYQTMTDVVAATIYFHDRFESSADTPESVRSVRGKFATDWYTQLHGSKPVVGVGATPTHPVFVVGDSLTVGSKADIVAGYQALQVPVTIHAKNSLTARDGVTAVQSPQAQAATGWVIALGTNDFDAKRFAAAAKDLMASAGERQVTWINISRPKAQDPINKELAALAETHHNLRIADFAAAAATRAQDFTADGIHLNAAGYQWRAQLYAVTPTASGDVGADPGCDPGSGGMSNCPPEPKGTTIENREELEPNALTVAQCVAAGWPAVKTIGGWRASDPYPDHPSGQAVDIMMPQGCAQTPGKLALGTQIAEFLMKNADAYRIQYIIWQQRIWTIQEDPKPVTDWRGMPNRGGCTDNHQDHVHVSTFEPPPGLADLGGFTYDYKTPTTTMRPCPPRLTCGAGGGTWTQPTSSDDWKSEAVNPGTDPGMRLHPIHHDMRCHAGWDLAAPSGQPITAAAAGEVATSYDSGGGGNYVTITHGGGVASLYMHMTSFAPSINGRHVAAGQLIGYVGSTGGSTAAHLHFEVRVNGVAKDPRHWMQPNQPIRNAC